MKIPVKLLSPPTGSIIQLTPKHRLTIMAAAHTTEPKWATFIKLSNTDTGISTAKRIIAPDEVMDQLAKTVGGDFAKHVKLMKNSKMKLSAISTSTILNALQHAGHYYSSLLVMDRTQRMSSELIVAIQPRFTNC
jgi:hypothetical protein